jgi:lactam utilization protein B
LIPLAARTLCVHGDGAQAVLLLRSVRAALEGAGFTIVAEVLS